MFLKIKHIVIFNLFLFNAFHLLAIENDPVGARSAGMANASVILKDVWAVHHNQAGIAYLESPVIGFYIENRYNIKELSLTSLAFAYPVWNGVIGFNLSYWGFKNFNTSKIGVCFSKKLGEKISAGLQIDYLNTYLSESYGNKGTVIAEAGIRAEPLNNFIIGAHIYNPTRAKLASYNDERLPTILRLGMAYNFSDKLLISVESEKNLIDNMVFKSGLEYKFADKFFIRGGVATDPIFNTFGFGYLYRNLSIDMAFSRHQVLGLIPHFSVNYNF